MAEGKAKSGPPSTDLSHRLEYFGAGELVPLHPVWVVDSTQEALDLGKW